MFSQLYIFFYVLYMAVVWLGEYNSLGQHERVFLSGALSCGIIPAMWFDTLRHFGLRSLRSVPMMSKVFLRSKRGGTLTGLVVLCLGFWLSPFATYPSPYRYHMSATLVLTIIFLWLQPPCVLMLGASNRTTCQALQSVSLALFPFRVVALLDQRRTRYFVGSFSPFTDNLRTESDHHWRTTVDRLVDCVPLIILDARTDTPIVVSEVKLIIDKPERLKNTIFVIGSEGQAPALQAHGVTANSPGVQVVQDEGIKGALKIWLKARGRDQNQAQQQKPPNGDSLHDEEMKSSKKND